MEDRNRIQKELGRLEHHTDNNGMKLREISAKFSTGGGEGTKSPKTSEWHVPNNNNILVLIRFIETNWDLLKPTIFKP